MLCVAGRQAGTEVLGLRSQALCRRALWGLLFWQRVGRRLAQRVPLKLRRVLSAVAAVIGGS